MGFCVPAPVRAQNLPGLQYFRLLVHDQETSLGMMRPLSKASDHILCPSHAKRRPLELH